MARRAAAPEPPKPTSEELEVALTEVETILGLAEEDKLKVTKKTTDEEIIEHIKKVADGQLYESDFQVREGEGEEEGVTYFSEAADKTLELIGVEVLPGEPPQEGAEPEPAKEEKKGGKAAAPAKGKDAGKDKDKDKGDKKKPTPPQVERYSRYQAFADAVLQIKKPISKADLDKAVSDMYVKKGNGKENAAENSQVVTRSLQVCFGLGYADTDKNGNIVFSDK